MAATEYSIEGSDGKPYGPVSLEALRQWASEGRVVAATTIIVHATGERVAARDVPGLFDGLPPAAAPPKKGTPTWVIVLVVLGTVGVCGCGLLSAILFPVFSQARYAARRTKGLSNMKQLALGALIYSNDSDDRLPPGMGSALAAKPYLDAYVRNDAVFRSTNPSGGEILGDARLSGKSTVKVSSPDSALEFYDGKPWPRGETLVSFLNGSVRSMPYSRVEGLKAKDPFGKGKGE